MVNEDVSNLRLFKSPAFSVPGVESREKFHKFHSINSALFLRELNVFKPID